MVRGVLLDMGGTLIEEEPFNQQALYLRRAEAAAPHLGAWCGRTVDPTALADRLNEAMTAANARASAGDLRTPEPLPTLRESLSSLGLALTLRQVEEFLSIWWSPTPEFCIPFPKAKETLEALSTQGLCLALVSNIFVPGHFYRELLDEWGWTNYLQTLIFSSDAGWRKPHPAIFQVALDALSISPSEAAFVGDNPVADIVGAQRLGLKTVWISQERPWERPEPQPDISINSIGDLLDALRILQ